MSEKRIMRAAVEQCLNADRVLVAASSTSRCFLLRKQIEQRFRENQAYGREPEDLVHLGRTLAVGGLELFADHEGHIFAGDEKWVVPVSE